MRKRIARTIEWEKVPPDNSVVKEGAKLGKRPNQAGGENKDDRIGAK